MNEIEEVDFESDKKPAKTAKVGKKKRKARAARAAPEKAKQSSERFPGLTRTACSTSCNANGCVISGKNYCAHPTKGGLQATDMASPEALQRLQAARDQINVRIDPDRFK